MNRPVTGPSTVPALQTIRGSRVRNHTEFGRELQRLARRALTWFLPDHDCGFQDGGCRVFAAALGRWSGGALPLAGVVVLGDRRRVLQHYVARSGDLCLDSDGLARRAELEAKMNHFEWPGVHAVLPLSGCTGLGKPPPSAEATLRLARTLARTFGPFREDLLPVAAPAERRPPS